MIGEDVVTSEYEAYTGRPDERFRPSRMEDEYPPSQPRAGRADVRIVCPARLGLCRWEMVNVGTPEARERAVVLAKPTVVLETIVDDLGAEGDVSDLVWGSHAE